MVHTAYIVECVRTAGGKKNGALREWHPISLGAATLDALVEKAGIDGAQVDDVIMGCVMQAGAQAGNIARNCVLASKRLPETVNNGHTLLRPCLHHLIPFIKHRSLALPWIASAALPNSRFTSRHRQSCLESRMPSSHAVLSR